MYAWQTVIYRVCHSKATQQQSRFTIQKWSKKFHSRVIDSPNLPSDTGVKTILVSRPLLTPLAQKLWKLEHVFILEYYFASKPFSALCEAIINAYPDKNVPDKTTVHWLETKFRVTWSFCDRKHVRRRIVLTGETLRNVAETAKTTRLLYWCH
jgi:hypothetical protein